MLVLLACIGCVFVAQERIFKTFEYHSSPLDWCEGNLEYHPWIVEFWNSMSSFVLAAVGVFGYLIYRQNKNIHKYEPQFFILWAMMVVVGLGSVWFHGTLSVAGQISDEVPIVVLAIIAVMMARPKIVWSGKSRDIMLSGHNIIRFFVSFTIFCLLFPVASHVFTLVCFPFCGYFFLTDYARSKNPLFRRLFILGFGSFSIAFGSWILDRVACEQITQFGKKYLWGYPQLHAVWHLFMSVTVWFMIALGMMMRAEAEGVKFKYEAPKAGYIPLVHLEV